MFELWLFPRLIWNYSSDSSLWAPPAGILFSQTRRRNCITDIVYSRCGCSPIQMAAELPRGWFCASPQSADGVLVDGFVPK
jgi:hypothetical protein